MNKHQRARSIEIKKIMRNSKWPITYKEAKRRYRYRSLSNHIVGANIDLYIIDESTPLMDYGRMLR